MKKITLFFITTFLLTGLIYSQDSGKTLFGGNLNIILVDDDSYFSVNPIMGKMIRDKVAIGLSVGFIFSDMDYYSQYSYYGQGKYLSLAPFVRIHNNITENFKYFIEPFAGKIFELEDDSEHRHDGIILELISVYCTLFHPN